MRQTMIRTLTTILAGAVCMMLAGCGAPGEPYQPMATPASRSVIYLYRPYEFLGSEATPMITCGHESIELAAGGYYAFVEDSGPVTCAAATDTKTELKFDARAGEQYFIREDVEPVGLGSHVQLSLMNAAVAGDEIKECNRQGIKQ
ncbi:MAG: hypothetical protein WCE23_13190 [Candidatus Binatus sp.]